jgi:hypothetical protein
MTEEVTMQKHPLLPGRHDIVLPGQRFRRADGSLPLMAGASPAAPVSYPLGPPALAGTTITVDVALQNPTRITRDIARLAEQRFFANRVFSDAGGIQGGAVLFELPPTTATDLFAERGFQEVAPGQEFPILTFLRGVPTIARPRKLGGKFFVTKEQRARNDVRLLTRAMLQAANTIALTLDSMAVAVLNAAITANSRTLAGQSWATAAGTTMTTRSGTNVATADLLAARKLVELEQRGQNLNSALIHPNQELSLAQAASSIGTSIDALFATAGITNWFSSPRVTAGTAILYEAGQVGGWANEFPLAQDAWYENATERNWYQWSVSPAMFVDNPYALVQVTGIA